MLHLSFAAEEPLRVLCLGAHSDDIEIGCGGTLIQLLKKQPNCEVIWVVLAANEEREREARKSAELYLANVYQKKIAIEHFRDSFFPSQSEALKEFFETLKPLINPDIIFTHYGKDLHQDHRKICDLTWNTFRNHMIVEYEILKYDGDIGTPNLFVAIEKKTCREKLHRLNECFHSQKENSWFDDESFMALMRIRGVECNSTTRYAEAFYCRKTVLGI